jgi:Arc/MetJ family transcription regulator
MARTTIEIDERLIATVMRVHGCKTMGEAVDFALRQLVGDPMTRGEMLAMQGTGWEGDLDAVKGSYEPWSEGRPAPIPIRAPRPLALF